MRLKRFSEIWAGVRCLLVIHPSRLRLDGLLGRPGEMPRLGRAIVPVRYPLGPQGRPVGSRIGSTDQRVSWDQ